MRSVDVDGDVSLRHRGTGGSEGFHQWMKKTRTRDDGSDRRHGHGAVDYDDNGRQDLCVDGCDDHDSRFDLDNSDHMNDG